MARLIQTLHILDAPFQRLSVSPQWIFHVSIAFSALIILAYILLGARSKEFDEVTSRQHACGFPPGVRVALPDVDDHLGCYVRQFTSLPGFHLPSHRLKVPLHTVDANRNAVNERERLRVFRKHRSEHAGDDAFEVRMPWRAISPKPTSGPGVISSLPPLEHNRRRYPFSLACLY